MKELWNDKRWQDNSDGWVSTMNKSKEQKELYKEYLNKTKAQKPLAYRDWLKKQTNNG
jgi:hypothetical protein|tara:strand:- start:2870 stop:3043 length:174 start_codon:yes stop_codon:yes gene_type:complete